MAGAGNKFVHMADELSEYYINMVPGFKSWDMCASEAIINSRLGIVSDGNINPINYDPDVEKFTIFNGIIAAKNKRIYDLSMERINQNGESLENFYFMILE